MDARSDHFCSFYESPAAQNYGIAINLSGCSANQKSTGPCASSLRARDVAGQNQFVYAINNDCLVAYQKTFGNNQIGMMTNAAIYLQVSITGQLVIFSTRARLFFFMDMPSPWLMSAFVVAQLIATLIAVYANWPFTAIQPMGWGWAAIVWVWSILWFIPLDLFKIAVSWAINGNPWTGLTEHRKALNFALNGGASHLGSKGGSRMGVAQNSRAYARASAARANQMRASAKK